MTETGMRNALSGPPLEQIVPIERGRKLIERGTAQCRDVLSLLEALRSISAELSDAGALHLADTAAAEVERLSERMSLLAEAYRLAELHRDQLSAESAPAGLAAIEVEGMPLPSMGAGAEIA